MRGVATGRPDMSTGKTRIAVVGFVWLLSCAAFAVGGWLAHRKVTRVVPPADQGMRAFPVQLPAARFVAISPNGSADDRGYLLNVFRDPPDADRISSIMVYSGGPGVIYASFHKTGGRLKNVAMKDGRISLRDLNFREDGSLEYETTYRHDREHDRVEGLRRYFDEKGTVVREQGLQYGLNSGEQPERPKPEPTDPAD
jgi:hypothetical protein